MQFTISDLPEQLDSALKERAKSEGKTLSEVAVEALVAYTKLGPLQKKRDLSFMGDMSAEDAKAIEQAHEFCDRVGLSTDSPA